MFELFFSNKAKKEIKRLDKYYLKRITELFGVLLSDPTPSEFYDLKKLSGSDNEYRIRIGKIRIIYEVDWITKRIKVWEVTPRETAYESR